MVSSASPFPHNLVPAPRSSWDTQKHLAAMGSDTTPAQSGASQAVAPAPPWGSASSQSLPWHPGLVARRVLPGGAGRAEVQLLKSRSSLEWKNHPTAAGRSVGPQLHPRCCRDTRFAMLPCWRLGQLYGKKKTSEGINGMEINDEIQSFSELCLALFEIRTFLKAG